MSYASYCQDQGIDCARRARMASSPEVVTYWRHLGLRGLSRLLKNVVEGSRCATLIQRGRVPETTEVTK